MKLLGNRILVEPVAGAEFTRGGIYLTEQSRDENNVGGAKLWRVLQVGLGRVTRKGVLIPVECEAGDRVICHSYNDGPVPFDDKRRIISADQILCVLPRTPQPSTPHQNADIPQLQRI